MDSERAGSARRAAYKCGVPSGLAFFAAVDGLLQTARGVAKEATRRRASRGKGQWDRTRVSEQCGLRRFWRVLVRFTKRVVEHGSLKVCAGPEDANAGLNEIAGRSPGEPIAKIERCTDTGFKREKSQGAARTRRRPGVGVVALAHIRRGEEAPHAFRLRGGRTAGRAGGIVLTCRKDCLRREICK